MASPGLPTDPFLAGHTCKNAPSPAVGHRFHPQNHPPKIDAKLVKKDNSNSIKIGCTTPQDNLTSCFYNHNELDLSNGFFREEEVFVWALYKYTIKTQEICLQISALLGERVYVVKKKRYWCRWRHGTL